MFITHLRCCIILGDIIDVLNNYYHPSDVTAVEWKKVKEAIKKKVAKGGQNTSAAISKVLAKVERPVLAQLPKIESSVRIARRAKHADLEQEMINPHCLEELI